MDPTYTPDASTPAPEIAIPSWFHMIAHLSGQLSAAATFPPGNARKVRKLSLESPEDKHL